MLLRSLPLGLLTLALTLTYTPGQAQLFKKSKKKPTPVATESPKKEKSLEDITKKCRTYPGLFTVYQDTTDGTLYLKVEKAKLGQEFIYFSHVLDGSLDAGYFRGAYRGSKIFTVDRYFERLRFSEVNTGYFFDPNSPLKKAEGANINQPVFYAEKILAQSKDSSAYLIKAEGLFLNEYVEQVKRTPPPGAKPGSVFVLGKLSSEKSRVLRIKSYPENTDVAVELVYEDLTPSRGGHASLTDARYVSVQLQHSILAVPQNSFRPRRDDPRIGYFMTKSEDMTTLAANNWKDVIHRWHLEKKDPSAPISEPVEPITFWMENTTPLEFREAIKEGVESWNIAFEQAGFKNAVVVKQQPDDADWDAGDIRYNVLRWTSSPRPPFGGYGPSFVNPRTGQILGADIMLELVYVTNRIRYDEVFALSGMEHLFRDEADLDPDHEAGVPHCAAGLMMHQQNLVGRTLASIHAAPGAAEAMEKEIVRQSVYRLVLHEVGHTLGLNHNFYASMDLSPEELRLKENTDKYGVTASVMEYPSINMDPAGTQKSLFYDMQPGAYDKWAIEYGYSTALEDAAQEEERLRAIAARSNERGHGFGNDADDMRSPGKGIDPRIMINDLSSDPVGYAAGQMQLIKKTYPRILERGTADGESYQNMRGQYLMLSSQYATHLSVVSRWIGGIYQDRSVKGQEGAGIPLKPVPAARQKEALNVLNDYAFAPNAFKEEEALYPYLLPQRRGFDHFVVNQDPRIQERILNIQKSVLAQLMHSNVLERMNDAQVYGYTYPSHQYLGDLNGIMFQADLNASVNIYRRNLQEYYVQQLLKMYSAKGLYDPTTRALALKNLNQIQIWLSNSGSGDVVTKAHQAYLRQVIKDGLEAEKKG